MTVAYSNHSSVCFHYLTHIGEKNTAICLRFHERLGGSMKELDACPSVCGSVHTGNKWIIQFTCTVTHQYWYDAEFPLTSIALSQQEFTALPSGLG